MKSNQVIMYGYVGNHLVCKQTRNGKKMVKLRLATHSRCLNEKGEYVNDTIWHNVIAWDKIASYAENNFVKGSRILLTGSIKYLYYSNPSGKTQVTIIKADSLVNLDR